MARKLVIEIECENDAFMDHHGEFSPAPELAFILTKFVTGSLSDGMVRPNHDVILRDSNGNRVGLARLTVNQK